MSAVRMCDKCGDIFSENTDGWSTFQGARVIRDEKTGQTRSVTEAMDVCSECTGQVVKPKERLALERKIHKAEDELGMERSTFDDQ